MTRRSNADSQRHGVGGTRKSPAATKPVKPRKPVVKPPQPTGGTTLRPGATPRTRVVGRPSSRPAGFGLEGPGGEDVYSEINMNVFRAGLNQKARHVSESGDIFVVEDYAGRRKAPNKKSAAVLARLRKLAKAGLGAPSQEDIDRPYYQNKNRGGVASMHPGLDADVKRFQGQKDAAAQLEKDELQAEMDWGVVPDFKMLTVEAQRKLIDERVAEIRAGREEDAAGDARERGYNMMDESAMRDGALHNLGGEEGLSAKALEIWAEGGDKEWGTIKELKAALLKQEMDAIAAKSRATKVTDKDRAFETNERALRAEGMGTTVDPDDPSSMHIGGDAGEYERTPDLIEYGGATRKELSIDVDDDEAMLDAAYDAIERRGEDDSPPTIEMLEKEKKRIRAAQAKARKHGIKSGPRALRQQPTRLQRLVVENPAKAVREALDKYRRVSQNRKKQDLPMARSLVRREIRDLTSLIDPTLVDGLHPRDKAGLQTILEKAKKGEAAQPEVFLREIGKILNRANPEMERKRRTELDTRIAAEKRAEEQRKEALRSDRAYNEKREAKQREQALADLQATRAYNLKVKGLKDKQAADEKQAQADEKRAQAKDKFMRTRVTPSQAGKAREAAILHLHGKPAVLDDAKEPATEDNINEAAVPGYFSEARWKYAHKQAQKAAMESGVAKDAGTEEHARQQVLYEAWMRFRSDMAENTEYRLIDLFEAFSYAVSHSPTKVLPVVGDEKITPDNKAAAQSQFEIKEAWAAIRDGIAAEVNREMEALAEGQVPQPLVGSAKTETVSPEEAEQEAEEEAEAAKSRVLGPERESKSEGQMRGDLTEAETEEPVEEEPAFDAVPIGGNNADEGELGALKGPKGMWSTRLTITVNEGYINGSQPTNIPLLVEGQVDVEDLLAGKEPTEKQKQIAKARAAERVQMGAALPFYDSIEEAESAAKAYSKQKGEELSQLEERRRTSKGPMSDAEIPSEIKRLMAGKITDPQEAVRMSQRYAEEILLFKKRNPDDYKKFLAAYAKAVKKAVSRRKPKKGRKK